MFGTGLRYPLSFYLLVILCLVAAIASLIPAIKLRLRYLIGIVGNLEYDVCVLTGDYRGKTYGPFEKSLEIINELRAQLKGPIFAVLGNHDSIHMAPYSYGSFAGSNGNPDDVQRVRANCSPRSTHFLSRRRRPSFLSS